jgi:methylase of polypeptide subunit release factors
MPRLLSDAEMGELNAALVEHGYTKMQLEAAVGTASPPKRAGLVPFLHATRRNDALALLARTFLAALPSPIEVTASHWSPRLRELLTASQLVEERDGVVTPRALLIPVRGQLFASDSPRLLETDAASGFVPPAHTHAASYLLDLMIRRPVDSALDLGTGCGVHALAATAFARHVVASDLNERAVRYAQFNSSLNGLTQVECLAGDLYGPVADREFDLIVGNPPFVPAPDREFTYRDAGMVLDGMTQRVIREGAGRLKPGGFLQVLCEWVEIEGESWKQRLAGWMTGLGCDVWVLRSPPQDPPSYAALRLNEIDTGRSATERSEAYGAWLEYFAGHRVKAIHPGVIVLRRRPGRNWMQIQPILREARAGAGEAILENLRACDFLAAHPRADSLLNEVLTPSPDLAIEQSHRRTGQGWEVAGIRAWLNDGLPFDAELDPASAMLLREFDGQSTVAECLQRFADAIGEDFPEVRRRCLPVLRFFIERGLLRPPAAGAARL